MGDIQGCYDEINSFIEEYFLSEGGISGPFDEVRTDYQDIFGPGGFLLKEVLLAGDEGKVELMFALALQRIYERILEGNDRYRDHAEILVPMLWGDIGGMTGWELTGNLPVSDPEQWDDNNLYKKLENDFVLVKRRIMELTDA